jgi:predicted dehydrogenase
MSKQIGIIGLGSIGLRHAKNLLGLGQEVMGYDPDIRRSEELTRLGGKMATLRMITSAMDMDGIIIASPTKNHAEHIEACLGFDRTVFVEKPIADKPSKDIFSVDMVGYNLRFHSGVIEAKKMLDAGDIGAPYWAEFMVAQACDRPEYLRDGVILNWSHEIDLALHMLGPAKVMASSTRLTNGQDDISDIMLQHDSGCRSFVHLDYIAKPERRDFTIFGAKGYLKANLTMPRSVHWHVNNQSHPSIKFTPSSFDLDYIEEMKAFIDLIDGKPNRGATADDGLRVLETCLEVRKQAGLS